MSASPACAIRFEDSPEFRFGILLGALTKTWRARLNQRLKPVGASFSVFIALCHLSREPEGLIQRDLAERIGVEGPTLVRLLDAMERDGWVKRVPSGTDRRQKRVVAMPKAREAFEPMAAVARELHLEIMAVATPAELEVASALMDRLVHRIEAL